MEYYKITDELTHHGIKGQKWGVRRFQKKDGSLTPAGQKRYNENTDDKINKESANKTGLKLTDKQKKAIKIGATVAVAALATYGAYRIVKSGKLSKMSKFTSIGKDIAGSIDQTNGLELQSNKSSLIDNIKAVNPKFSFTNRNYYMNCGNCGIAFEARMRGYNVTAKGNPNGMTIPQIGQFFKGLKSESFTDIDIDIGKLSSDIGVRGKQVEDTIKNSILKSHQASKDARGMLFFPGDFGSHWVSWVKDGDNINFINSQNSNVNLTRDVFSHYKYHRNMSKAALTSIRLDDLEINSDNIHSVIENVHKNVVSPDTFNTFVEKGQNFVMTRMNR